MISAVTKFCYRHESKLMWKIRNDILKKSFGSGEPCPPPPPCPCPPAKPEVPSEPEPPPCPKLPPPCPPPLCAKIPDPANPCNYCPPVCIDPDYPDLTKLKKNQCKFQKDNGIPIFLKGGNLDVIFYQASLIATILGIFYSLYTIIKI